MGTKEKNQGKKHSFIVQRYGLEAADLTVMGMRSSGGSGKEKRSREKIMGHTCRPSFEERCSQGMKCGWFIVLSRGLEGKGKGANGGGEG